MSRYILIVKRIISCLIFGLLTCFFVAQMTELLTPKSNNRYYILEKYLEEHPKDNMHDVQVFGSCHSYTSFNPVYFENRTGISAFVYGNAGEIIPTTYVRMNDQFKKHTPKVALVEIWGINPYETYDTRANIFGSFLAKNLERTKFSLAKQEVIGDYNNLSFEDEDTVYDQVDFIKMNFPIVNYKARFLDHSLTDVDFCYSFENTSQYSSEWLFREMVSRTNYKGYNKLPPSAVTDYSQKQSHIQKGESIEIESDIVKYIKKIIDLCRKNNVKLIFYRSPYISSVNELKKLNHMKKICSEYNILFIDLEAEISYDYNTDFADYQHLSEIGANRSTEFLIPYILHAMK